MPVAVLGSALALAAAGCGGSSSDTKANEAYANSVCTAIGNWEQELKSIATDFSAGISQAAFQSKVTQAEAATQSLATEIKAIPPPDSSQGQAVKQQLDQLSSDATTTVAATKAAVSGLDSDASAATIAVAVLTVTPQVKALVTTAESTLKTLKDSGGEIASAFKSTDSCKNLGSGS